MTRKERARIVAERLESLFPDPPIPLDHRDPYTLLVAVLLSAQCTDKRVNQVTPTLFAMANDPASMAALPTEVIDAVVRPCGLSPTKARNIRELSRLLVERHESLVPQDLDALKALPGVGHKTASVVMVQAFGVPAFPVDTHIHRLAQVWGLSTGPGVARTERDLKALFPPSSWNKLHLRIISYGREVCQARGCNRLRCALCQELFPGNTKPYTHHKA